MRKIVTSIKLLLGKIICKMQFDNQVEGERITNIFNYGEIIKDRPGKDRKVLLSNRYYGMNYDLKRYTGYKGVINAAIEHGPNLDCEDGEYKDKSTPALVVQSNQRKNFVREKRISKPVFAIGTSIYYGESIFNEYEKRVTKDNLGKTLLIYPVHDIENFHYIQSTEAFIDFVKSIVEEHHFDTVLVCMYFVDIERGRHLRFQKEGWTIVSAGRRQNYDFCDMMKTIIELADFAIFQHYTSAIGFCTYMKVPSMIYHQDVLFSEKGRDDLQTDMGVKDETMKQFERVFENYDENINKEKYDFCNYWFGFDEVLSKDELKLLFMYFKKIRCGDSSDRLRNIAKKKKYEPIRHILYEAIEGMEK